MIKDNAAVPADVLPGSRRRALANNKSVKVNKTPPGRAVEQQQGRLRFLCFGTVLAKTYSL